MTSPKDLKALLIQIREDQGVKEEEKNSFLKYSGLTSSQLDTFDVFQKSQFTKEITQGYDLIFVGGASDASVLEPDKYTFVNSLQNTLKHCAKTKIPTFASCFGFQAAILALGGEIIHQEKGFEMGTYPIEIVQQKNLIFQEIPNYFQGISVHKEKAINVPKDCHILAKTDQCIHIFQYKDHPFFAFQFHPELDKKTLVERLRFYQSKYTENPQQFEDIIEGLKETPFANNLLKNFIKNIVIKKAS